jgi:hypothetical protein
MPVAASLEPPAEGGDLPEHEIEGGVAVGHRVSLRGASTVVQESDPPVLPAPRKGRAADGAGGAGAAAGATGLGAGGSLGSARPAR